ncbi:MAG: gas vesicle protein [Myxacorys californica WJT36-NPBG1]|nr:gas vesicle protein [Myxacorys californica WJT36-NPBG1]
MPARASASGGREAGTTIATSTQGSSLADVLERVLDKGIVIAGDISVSVASTELLNIRIRLLISSVDKAKEIGINWWENNPHFSAQSKELNETNQRLLDRVEALEAELKSLRQASVQKLPQSTSGSLESLLKDL